MSKTKTSKVAVIAYVKPVIKNIDELMENAKTDAGLLGRNPTIVRRDRQHGLSYSISTVVDKKIKPQC